MHDHARSESLPSRAACMKLTWLNATPLNEYM